MSTQKKDDKGIVSRLLAVVDKYSRKLVALDLTTDTGDKITFPDVKEGEMPKAGDKATIDDKEVPDGTVTIVDNEGTYTITFKGGVVVEDKTEAETEIEALKEENAELTARLTAMESEFRTILAEMTSEEPDGNSKKNPYKPSTVPKTLSARLAEVKKKKANLN